MIQVTFTSDEDKERMASLIRGYLHGHCYLFAVALHYGLGLPLVGIVERNIIIHAGVKVNENTYRDARGDTTIVQFTEEFGGRTGEVQEISEEQLMSLLKERESERILEKLIREARDVAESIWPEWVWEDSKLKKFQAFAEDLEALSRKYGIWIREMSPATAPILYTWDGDEEGYTLEQVEGTRGLKFLLRRDL